MQTITQRINRVHIRGRKLNEEQLRVAACNWLKKHYPQREYYLEPIVFHGIGLTITEYLHKKFKGNQLICIPYYNELQIRPDIIGILKFNRNGDFGLGWLIGECKVGKVNTSDLRQAVYYANTSKAYESYLFYNGILSKEVEDLIKTGGHLYQGINKWGKTVKKRLIIVKHDGNRFVKSLL
jgi:hypothetical protein